MDASIAASWFLPDENSELAAWVLDQMQTGLSVAAPSVWPLEMTNILLQAERRKRLSREVREAALDRLETIRVAVLPPPSAVEMRSVRRLAEKHRLTAYDAEYLRVARLQFYALASADRELVLAARRDGVEVVRLPEA